MRSVFPSRRRTPLGVVRWLTSIVLILWLAGGCGRSGGVRLHTAEPFPQKLSPWRLVQGDLAKLRPNQRVIPYDLNTPLFSDHAEKHRFLWMPPGTAAVYHETETFQFPVGTI